MSNLDEHLLVFEYLGVTTAEGDVIQRHTTQGGKCLCGWECWSKYRDEIEVMHDAHLAYIKQKHEETFVMQHMKDMSIHQIHWRGPNAAQCRGCSWYLTGPNGPMIQDAFMNHKRRAMEELNR